MASSLYRAPRRTGQTRRQRSAYDPLRENAKLIADTMWERAMEIAKIFAPDIPTDAEELPEEMQWLILEVTAMNLSPESWDDPAAIQDLHRLRKQFAPSVPGDDLPVLARYKQRERELRPDPSISPQNPAFEEKARRLGVA